ATPVALMGGGGGGGGEGGKGEAGKGEAGKEKVAGSADAMRAKAVNDAAAYLRSLAELRGRNAEGGEKAVREGASLSAPEALREKVIDVVAPDLAAVLAALDGRVLR